MTKLIVLIAIFIISILCFESVAASENQTLTQVSEFSLRSDVVSLLELSTKSPKDAESLIPNYIADRSNFNYAEQYLLLLAQANIKQHQQQHKMVIDILEQTTPLTKYIAQNQLKQPLFSEAYLVLATSHAALKDYKNAYHNKKTFVDDFNDYSDTKRENTVEKITEKYEIANKNQENELLDNQNKLKALHLKSVQQQQQDLQKKILLIFSTILLFVLLFLRQFKVRKKLLLLSETDGLTALLNRAALFKQGHILVKKANAEKLELSVLLFDIDAFKQINDRFGYSVGDAVLKKISELISETMRSRDVFGRLVGEQFVAILPSSDLSHAKAIAVRMLEKISQHDFNEQGVNYQITLSLGIATINDINEEFDDILHAADLAMYQAKALGKNQIVTYDSIVKDQERRQR